MKFIADYRASAILYHFIISNDLDKGTWILPTNICHYVAATILKTGASIEVIDVSKKDFCLDESIVISKLKSGVKKYTGIIYVRGFGVDNKAASFFKKIKKINNKILLVDDKCLSIPSLTNRINSLVDLELYSTGYSKYVDLGYGGYAKLNDSRLYLKSALPYLDGEEQDFDHYFKRVIFGNSIANELEIIELVNSKWLKSEEIDINAYFAEIKLKLSSIKKHKDNINAIYDQVLVNNNSIAYNLNNWRYNIFVNNRDEILEELKKEHLFASKHYFPLSKIFKSEESPVWDNLQKKVLNLFNDFRYSELEARKTAELINKIIMR